MERKPKYFAIETLQKELNTTTITEEIVNQAKKFYEKIATHRNPTIRGQRKGPQGLAFFRCGYVLKPKCMFDDQFDPYDRSTLHNVEPLTLTVQIIAARHLMKTSKGIVSPFVEAELVGADYDCYRFKTSTKEDNGLNPVWKESFRWTVYNPELAIIRFVFLCEDMFGDPNVLAQAAYPITCLRTGYRSIALKNEFSEELELSCLLVHIDMQKHSHEVNSFNSNQPQELSLGSQQRFGDVDVPSLQSNQELLGREVQESQGVPHRSLQNMPD
ncbi:1-phosphatidylinositol 4,5-bisphosphate phosphodiesterase gamma-1 [Nephila pilipes]|uniref:1-phosphatidylinositol 4,5-bisphosphate phosphodiesterase gamma-1 n=1 Tax=Nephila pilipes TaxID=299642 RepID=A0A8X6QQ80_NEPPI|nr:1-phosphatidylinositol 4,5-bisphosphate phosphodiesterase gamma-1 [Nephila pilipes]